MILCVKWLLFIFVLNHFIWKCSNTTKMYFRKWKRVTYNINNWNTGILTKQSPTFEINLLAIHLILLWRWIFKQWHQIICNVSDPIIILCDTQIRWMDDLWIQYALNCILLIKKLNKNEFTLFLNSFNSAVLVFCVDSI